MGRPRFGKLNFDIRELLIVILRHSRLTYVRSFDGDHGVNGSQKNVMNIARSSYARSDVCLSGDLSIASKNELKLKTSLFIELQI